MSQSRPYFHAAVTKSKHHFVGENMQLFWKTGCKSVYKQTTSCESDHAKNTKEKMTFQVEEELNMNSNNVEHDQIMMA